jgi:hypothetical protein
MNLLELQVRIVISGVPESGPGRTLLEWPLPALKLLSTDRLPFAGADAIEPPVRRADPQP